MFVQGLRALGSPPGGPPPGPRLRAFHLAMPDGKPKGALKARPAASPRAGLVFFIGLLDPMRPNHAKSSHGLAVKGGQGRVFLAGSWGRAPW
jgi:hypothetical protein